MSAFPMNIRINPIDVTMLNLAQFLMINQNVAQAAAQKCLLVIAI
jgi:hypothetical protein